MSAVILIAIISLILFTLAYITRRRFGVMGLALIAGQSLVVLWTGFIPMLAATIGLPSFGTFSGATIVTLMILFLPPVMLLFGGPTYDTKKGRMVGSLLFAVLALVLSAEILQGSLILLGDNRVVFDMISQHRTAILSAAIAIAVLDLMSAHSSKLLPKKMKGSKS